MDVETFRSRYPAWLEATRPLLEAKDWGASFKTYPFAVNTESPWAPQAKPLAECRVALLSTAGLYVPGEQPPFRAEDIEGDWSFRELPEGVAPEALAIAHDHYDHTRAETDRNCVYPHARLRELATAGVIGEVASRHYSISGYCTRPDHIVERSAPQIVQRLRQDRVDVLLHVPV
ncbi:MAG TPA: glycine/sarcosine/betaine reductase selenoprotein B family protein [bacterium]|nr:glycine/sarcosine/betaine reductase selenoprotein B family protein [bacterium]